MSKKFSPELRERAVRMVYDRQSLEGGPRSASIRVVASQLGVGEETLRIWCNRYGAVLAPTRPAESLEEIGRIHAENCSVYGIRKMSIRTRWESGRW